ncbi:MAG: hypothetical protein WCO30_00130 [bacterium]
MKTKITKFILISALFISFFTCGFRQAEALILDPQVIISAIVRSGITGDALVKSVAIFQFLKEKNVYLYMPTFTRNLFVGVQDGNDIVVLKKLMNFDSATRLTNVDGSLYIGTSSPKYDAVTKASIVRFQEKYAPEILWPLNLSSGTGYVGSSTRAKLNKMDYDYDMALLNGKSVTQVKDKSGKTVTVGMIRDSKTNQVYYGYVDNTGYVAYSVIDPITGISTRISSAPIFYSTYATSGGQVGTYTYNPATGTYTPSNNDYSSNFTSSSSNGGAIYNPSLGTYTNNSSAYSIPGDLTNTTDMNNYLDGLRDQFFSGQITGADYLFGNYSSTTNSGFQIIVLPAIR